MSRAATKAKENGTVEAAAEAAPEGARQVAQIQVTVFVLNEYGSPVPLPGGQLMFGNTAEGTAAEHMIGWAAQSFLNTTEPI